MGFNRCMTHVFLKRYKFQSLAALLFLVVVIAGFLVMRQGGGENTDDSVRVARAQSVTPVDVPDANWLVRCNGASGEEDAVPVEVSTKNCEVYQRLVLKETNQRLVEFAVGFPEGQKAGRGVMILPLGIILSEPVSIKVDDKESFSFDIRYCTQQGCFAFLTMNEAILTAFRDGDVASITFQAMDGKVMKVNMSLDGFVDALKKLA